MWGTPSQRVYALLRTTSEVGLRTFAKQYSTAMFSLTKVLLFAAGFGSLGALDTGSGQVPDITLSWDLSTADGMANLTAVVESNHEEITAVTYALEIRRSSASGNVNRSRQGGQLSLKPGVPQRTSNSRFNYGDGDHLYAVATISSAKEGWSVTDTLDQIMQLPERK